MLILAQGVKMSEVDFSDFKYCENSPSHLVWDAPRYVGENALAYGRVGKTAGSFDKISGYWFCRLNGVRTSVHRVIWQMFYGAIPDGYNIDHFDRDKCNNNIKNLRCVPEAVNSRNCKMWKTNTSGICGVLFRSGKYPAWRATWVDSLGVKRDKHFACKKYGHETAFKLACEYRERMLQELNNNGFGYSENHGTQLETD